MVMNSTNVKNLRIGERFGKGCKTLCKVVVVGVIATSLMAPLTANAAVDPCVIVSDQQYCGSTYPS